MNNNKLFITAVITIAIIIIISITHDSIAANNVDNINKIKDNSVFIAKFMDKDKIRPKQEEDYKSEIINNYEDEFDDNWGVETYRNNFFKKCDNEDNLSKEEKLDCKIAKKEMLLQKRKNKIEKNLIHPEGDLHVVSVYEGKTDIKAIKPGKDFTEGNRASEITVDVKNSERPVSLLLSSYEPVLWKIKADNPSNLKEIFLSSYYESKVQTPKSNIPVKKIKNIDVDDRCKSALEETFAVEPVSIQYEYYGESFVVDGNSNVKYDEIINHQSTDKEVNLICEEFSCVLSDDKLSYAIKRGGFLGALTNKYHKSGKYYFETQFFIKQNGGHTAGTNVGICSPYYPNATYCDFFMPTDEDKNEKYSVLGWAAKLNDKDIIGIAVDFDEGKIYVSKNGEWRDCIPEKGKTLYTYTPKGKEFTAAFSIAQDVSLTANFGAKKFKYKIPKGFKPYDEYSAKKRLIFL